MQFLYFLPGWKSPQATIAQLDELGLGHIHDGVGPRAMQCRGPGGVDGLLVGVEAGAAPEKMAGKFVYKPDAQTWRPGLRDAEKNVRWHIGHWNDPVPWEASLRRRPKNRLPGRPVALRDGTEWEVPVAYAKFGNSTLPKVLTFDDEQQRMVGVTAPGYEAIQKQAETAFDLLSALAFGERNSYDFDEVSAIAVGALATNYRVGLLELSMLTLLGQQETLDVVEHICDWKSFKQVLKARDQGNAVAAGT